LRFLIDHCVSRYVSDALQAAGHEVELLRAYLPPDSADPEVISLAQNLDSILISLNGDFANIINYPPANYAGIIALQVKNNPASIPATVVRLLTYLSAHPDRGHYARKLFLIEPHRIRIRE
jgi:predicted nuclease of predicted toxin-antitoxin system